MKCYDLVVVGGGAAGLFGAAVAAEKGLSVLLLERNSRCGRKISITGKGRCNLTNTRKWSEFSEHIHPNPNFFKNAFFGMSNERTMTFFERIGLSLTVERGQRVFPASMRAQEVNDVLLAHLKKAGVTIMTETRVRSASKEGKLFKTGTEPEKNGRSFFSKKLLVATGGLSYPATGSTGDGYEMAKNFGHKIIPCFPSLTALIPLNYNEALSGITLKNIEISLYLNGVEVESEFGEVEFTDDGIEGAAAIKLSRKAVHALLDGQKVELAIDLKPALSPEQLALRIERERRENGRETLNLLLKRILPGQLVAPFMNSCRGLEIKNLPLHLKEWRFKVISYVGYRRSVVTAGGVDLGEISPKSMESKLVKGLYFAGEVLNLDGDTGGYNLQIAFSTAALAAESVVRELTLSE